MLHDELAAISAPVRAMVLTPGGVLSGQMLRAKDLVDSGEVTDPAVKEFITSRIADAVEPIEVGRLVVRAIRGSQLYVNTHRETVGWLQKRLDRIAADAATLGTLR
jgi:hypothetical protein